MALALIVLAIGSVAAGYIGIPHAPRWTQRARRLARAVVLRASRGWRGCGERGGCGSRRGGRSRARCARADADGRVAGDRHRRHRRSRTSSGCKRREIADNDGAQLRAGLHRLLLNKYYVDELYDATIVQPIKVVSHRRPVARVRRARDRRRGQRRRVHRGRQRRRAAAAADRVGARLRRIAVRRRGADPGLLPMAMNQRQLPTSNSQLQSSGLLGNW